jgi:hypothetical protein
MNGRFFDPAVAYMFLAPPLAIVLFVGLLLVLRVPLITVP